MTRRKRKFAATISTDKIVWDTFVIWARQQNSTASELITKFMEQSVTSGEYVNNLYEQRENLESLLRKLIVEELEKRDNFWLEYLEKNNILLPSNSNNNNPVTDSTDNTDGTDKRKTAKSRKQEKLYTDKELKERENLSCHQTTITRWRQGKSNMPEYIANNYEIVGTRWQFIGKN